MPRQRKRPLPPGMYQRGNKYWCSFSVGGKRIRKPLSTDVEVAKTMLRKLRLRHEAGEIDNDYEFTELVEGFFRARSGQGGLRPSTVARYRECVELFVDSCAPKYVSDITADDAIRHREAREADKVTGDVIQYEIDRVRQILTWGCKRRLIRFNPLQHVDRIKTIDKPDILPFTPDEAESIVKAARRAWRDFLWIAFATGLRKSELIGLNVEDIDLDARLIHVPKRIAKTAASVRSVPMLEGVLDRLARRCEGREAGAPVFIGECGPECVRGDRISGMRAWQQLINAADRSDVWTRRSDAAGRVVAKRDFHSTRRSFATWLRENGAERELVEDLLGHRRHAVTDRYLSFGVARMREAISHHPWGVAALPDEVLPMRASAAAVIRNAVASA